MENSTDFSATFTQTFKSLVVQEDQATIISIIQQQYTLDMGGNYEGQCTMHPLRNMEQKWDTIFHMLVAN